MPMQIHVQRKRVFSMEPAELERLDLSAYCEASDIQVAVIPDEEGMWLVVIQDTPVPLDQVPILPGFHRTGLGPGRKPPKLLN